MNIIRNLDFYLFCILIFLFPFGKSFFFPVFSFWICLCVITYFIHKDFKLIKSRLLIFPVLLYIAYFFSPTILLDFKKYFSELQFYLPLLLVPILYPYNRTVYKINYDKLLWIFTLGCTSASIFYFFNAIFKSIYLINNSLVFNPISNDGFTNYFFGANLSFLIHPSYFALYLTVALAYIGLKLNNWAILSNRIKYISILMIIIMLTSLAFLQSRTGLICLGLVIITWGFGLVIKRKKILLGLLLIVFFGGVSLIVFSKFDRLATTIRALKLISEGKQSSNEKREEQTFIRIWIWKSAISVINEQPFRGVGPSYVKDKLYNEYLKRELVIAASSKLNAHNQFLETWLGIGFFGLVLLLITLLVPLWLALKKNDWLLFYFISLCSISFMFESMLERVAGLTFFVIFYCIFTTKFSNNS